MDKKPLNLGRTEEENLEINPINNLLAQFKTEEKNQKIIGCV